MGRSSFSVLCLALASTIFIACSLPTSSKEPIKILFIGSSYFNYNTLPEIFRQLSEQGGESVFIDQYIPSGLFLADHAESSVTRSKIKSANWDFVVLQGIGVVMAYPDQVTQHPVYPSIKSLMKTISRNSPSTKTLFCMPWAYEDGMEWKEGWSDNYDMMQQKIIHTTMTYSQELGFLIAPVGQAWSDVLKQKGYPLHYLHFRDYNHPTKKGSYLMACVIYSSIFQKSSVPVPYTAGVDPEEALFFREIGSHTVLERMKLWNIPVITE